jgi:hypothetical protein
MQTEAVAHDALLHASRRVDWRFLLPRPDLGRVAYIGERDPELIESLQVFSDELSVSQSSTANGRESSFDLVVIRNATLADLEAGRELLNPGAWLYVEVERPQRRKRARAARSARGYAQSLRKLGLVDVSAYVHWPDFSSCRAIVPLEDAVAVRYGLERGQVNSARLVMRLARLLALTHQLAHFVPCASVVGRAPSSGEEGAR